MALPAPRRRAATEIPTSSLADIAFLLLIFFLVTTVFDEERGLALVLPADEVVDVNPSNVLHLLVNADGSVEVRRGESANAQVVRADEVRAIWRREVARNELLIAGVKTHPDARYGSMIDLLDALQAAGATRIALQSRD